MGRGTQLSDTTLAEFLRSEWLPAIRTTVRATTFANYVTHVECQMVPHLGHLRLKEIHGRTINAFYATFLPKDLIFESCSGVSPTVATKRFRRLIETHGLPVIRLHDLRHTHATLALQAGVHPKIVSERLGHSTVSLTLDVYSHAVPHMPRMLRTR